MIWLWICWLHLQMLLNPGLVWQKPDSGWHGFNTGIMTRPEAFERQTRLLRYNLINDYWAIRALKAMDDGSPGAAREYFNRSLSMSRGKDFPARLVEIWMEG